jgi:hypothetical protein
MLARFTPRYVEGNIWFNVDGLDVLLERQRVSYNGCFDLPWKTLNKEQHYGRKVHITVSLFGRESFAFECEAVIVNERTSGGAERMGIKFFHMDRQVRAGLDQFLDKFGKFPDNYSRRYPRLPAAQFELQAAVTCKVSLMMDGKGLPRTAFKTRVQDLNPEGLLLSSYDAKAGTLEFGNHVALELVTSGALGNFNIPAEAKVRRILQERDSDRKLDQWSIGLQIVRISEEARRTYYEYLKNLLLKVRS